MTRRQQALLGWVLGAVAFRLLTGCVTADDYKEPAVGITALGGVEQCRQNPTLPCGWVYQCREVEICLPWVDRAEIPKLREMAESLYGDCELSRDPRFAGTPLCRYVCPSERGCNARNGCWCLEPAP
jgi:hypothetical protein